MKKQLFKHCCAVFLAGFIALLLLPQAAQAQSKEAYVVKSSDKKTLTFYYDDQKSSRTGSNVWGIEETKEVYGNTHPAWSGTWNTPESEVTTTVFDTSFKNYRPKSTGRWFLRIENLEKIEGLEYLNTSAVTTMRGMFYGCSSLTSLNLYNFDTENVQNMSSMFEGCSSLTSLNLSSFKTENVQNMSEMFRGCYRLTFLDLSNFKTENVQDMWGMFEGCQSLTSLNLENFDTEKVTDMAVMFDDCKSLTTIYCNKTWTCAKSKKMFSGCTSLQGAVNYDESKTDASMANPETGYFTKKGITGVATATIEGDASIQTIYSTDGRRLNELQRGLKIVRMSNGTTQKILRK